MELFPFFALFRGLYELAQYSALASGTVRLQRPLINGVPNRNLCDEIRHWLEKRCIADTAACWFICADRAWAQFLFAA